MDIQIVLPPVSEDNVSSGLRYLTQVLVENNISERHSGFLGGELGYGTNFENDIFMIHSYCWCDREDCKWCAGCECPDSAFHFYVDGAEVTWDEWMKFYTDRVPNWDHPDYERLSTEMNSRRTESQDLVCDFCKSGGKPEPNFYHKATELKVWWYKYIGRSMEIEGSKTNWPTILQDCLTSLS